MSRLFRAELEHQNTVGRDRQKLLDALEEDVLHNGVIGQEDFTAVIGLLHENGFQKDPDLGNLLSVFCTLPGGLSSHQRVLICRALVDRSGVVVDPDAALSLVDAIARLTEPRELRRLLEQLEKTTGMRDAVDFVRHSPFYRI